MAITIEGREIGDDSMCDFDDGQCTQLNNTEIQEIGGVFPKEGVHTGVI